MVQARSLPAGEPPASELLAGCVAELEGMYGDLSAPGMSSATEAELGPPGGAYVVLLEDGTAVAGGGFKRVDEATCEIKRMFVVPAARGRSLARVLLGAIEDEARRLGYRRARLDTGREQPHAQRLYETAGYVAVPDFNGNLAASYWGAKDL